MARREGYASLAPSARSRFPPQKLCQYFPDGIILRWNYSSAIALHPIREAQAQEAHEREPVADLILDLVVREVVERLQNRHFDDDDLVPRHASGRGLSLLVRLAPNRAQPRAEILPGHDRVRDNQRVLLGIETAITLAKVEEPRLTHSCPSL